MLDWKYGDSTFVGNTVNEYLVALGVFIVVWAVLRFVKFTVVRYLKRLSAKTHNDVDDMLIKVFDSFGVLFYVAVSVYAAIQYLRLSPFLDRIARGVVLFAFIWYGMRALGVVVDFATRRIIEKKDENNQSLVRVLGKMTMGAFWVLAILFFLSNMGVNITTFVAGLGVGGVAIAFALQNILGDIFASFSLYFDQPFEVGDFIVIGDDKGMVNHIGIKSTRIQTLQGQELVVSNKELTSTRVNNYKKMEKRRISFSFGVTYDTSIKHVKAIPDVVRDIIDGIDKAEVDRVHFSNFGDSALQYEVVYYIDSSEYNVYMDIQEMINVKLMEAFEEKGIEFAFPSRTVYMAE